MSDEYIVEVHKKDDESRMFRYHIKIIDPETKWTAKNAWAPYKFLISRRIRKALKEVYKEEQPTLLATFKVKGPRREDRI